MNFATNLLASFAMFTGIFLGLASPAFAVRTYQVTGPVLEVTETKIVVQKGKEKWEIDRTPTTKEGGIIQVGSKVVIEYTMTAQTVNVKSGKPNSPTK